MAHIGLTEGIASSFLPKKHWPRTGGWFHPQFPRFAVHTVDGSEILHQLIGCLSYKVLYIPGGAGFLPSTVFQYFHQILAKCLSRVVNFWGKTDSTPLPPVSPFSWLFLFLSSTLLSCLVSDSSHLCCSYYRIVGSLTAKLPLNTLPETNSSPLKIDPWKRRFLLETTIFRGELLVLGGVVFKSHGHPTRNPKILLKVAKDAWDPQSHAA